MRLLVVFPLLLAPCQEKPQRRYEVEILYVTHKNVTAQNYKRIEALFSKSYPKLDLAKLAPTEKDLKEYYGLHRDRLLRQVAPGMDPKLVDYSKGWTLVQEQVRREVRVRGMFWWFLMEAKRRGSVKAVFDHLVQKDDPKRPVCATNPSKGLVVHRHVAGTARQLENLKDGDVRFGPDFSSSVRSTGSRALPAFPSKPMVFGPDGHLRVIFRILKVHRDPAPKVK